MTVPPLPDVRTVRWSGDAQGALTLIDQTKLPGEMVELNCPDAATIWEAIKSLRVRGAPAIGIAAAYGLVIGVRAAALGSSKEFFAKINEVASYLGGSRPTAVNLHWALERMKNLAESRQGQPNQEILNLLLQEAQAIEAEDREACHAIGRFGAELIARDSGVLTHCNAGGLATADYGTALAVIYAAQEQGKSPRVYADETRPLLQGSRLTAWELMARGVDVTLICDSMAAQVMREGRIHAVITGADRIAANGDSANKIGTYGVALLAAAHGIPFYIAAPTSTFDLSLPDGSHIPIEERSAEEITHVAGVPTAPKGVKVYNPAFDVTPASLIHAIICERGVIQPVTTQDIRGMVGV